jgi:glycine oxidase
MRAAVIGAGIVGLACAEELLRAGHDVQVFDPAPARGATHAAAGMLAPAGEAWHGETALLRLGLASAASWSEYAARLTATSGIDVDLRSHGTLLLGRDHDDLAQVRRTLDVLDAHGISYTELDRREAAAHEPALARVAGGALLPDDHNVNPRRVAEALLHLLGDRLVRAGVDLVDGWPTLPDGTRVDCHAVVVATGAHARGLVPWVRPVCGETIRLRAADAPTRVLRALVHGEAVYLVPRAGGEVVVGASEEEHADPATATLGPVLRLLGAARTLLPGLETAEILETTARHRPGTPDNGPVLGLCETDTDGHATGQDAKGRPRQVLALGHYRAGVLLAPLTAQVVRALVEGTAVPTVALPFGPDRFRPQRSDANGSSDRSPAAARPRHRPTPTHTAILEEGAVRP